MPKGTYANLEAYEEEMEMRRERRKQTPPGYPDEYHGTRLYEESDAYSAVAAREVLDLERQERYEEEMEKMGIEPCRGVY